MALLESIRTGLAAAAVLGAAGCAGNYRDALCSLGRSSIVVAAHYQDYVAADPEPDRQAARQAEARQFQRAVEEATQQCLYGHASTEPRAPAPAVASSTGTRAASTSGGGRGGRQPLACTIGSPP